MGGGSGRRGRGGRAGGADRKEPAERTEPTDATEPTDPTGPGEAGKPGTPGGTQDGGGTGKQGDATGSGDTAELVNGGISTINQISQPQNTSTTTIGENSRTPADSIADTALLTPAQAQLGNDTTTKQATPVTGQLPQTNAQNGRWYGILGAFLLTVLGWMGLRRRD